MTDRLPVALAEAGSSSSNDDQHRIRCCRCGNRCRRPPSSERIYACPLCGERLGGVSIGERATDLRASARRLFRRLRLALTLPAAVAGIICVVRIGLPGDRAAASAPVMAPSRPAPVQLNQQETHNYAYRLRQLERDLRRDPADFEVLRRLGELNLELAGCQVEDSAAYLRQARYYLQRARLQALSRWEAAQIEQLMELANAPNPSVELAGVPVDAVPPGPLDPDWIRWRIGYLVEQARSQPHNSRLLRRMADTWLALASALGRTGGGGPPRGRAGGEALEAVRLSESYYERAQTWAKTDEARCRALYGQAELYRAVGEPGHAAAVMEQCLAIQPNNWLIAMRAAALYRQMRQPEEAERLEAQWARWKTPAWL